MKPFFLRSNPWAALPLLLLALSIPLSACTHKTTTPAAEKKQTIGFMPGPYSDQFKRGVQPILKDQGYTVEVIEFNNSSQPNEALLAGSIDANVFQHEGYLASYNEQNHAELSELTKVPTAPLGIYSGKYQQISELKEGARITIPNDPSNLARAIHLLALAGIVTIDSRIDPLTATEKDIIANPKDVLLLPIAATLLPSSLGDADFSVITGNYVLAAGMRLSEALLLERPPEAYQLVVAVRTADLGKPFAKDLAAAYQSELFRRFIETDDLAKGFPLPEHGN